MKQDELTIRTLASEAHVAIDYSDDDVIIIDNVKALAEPSALRLRMNLIAICTQGRVQVELNGQRVELKRNQLLICPPNITFTGFMLTPDFEFKALFLTTRILQSFLREKMHVWNEMLYIYKLHVVDIDDEGTVFFSHFYDLLRLYIDSPTHIPYKTDIIQSLIRGAILGLCGSLQLCAPVSPPASLHPMANLFQRFLGLLEATPQKHQPVDYYASQLCISPKYLSAVCKRNSGKTANEWITEHVVEDIRYYLRSTDLSVKQICNQLGFANSSFFGKYVREHFGMTPREVRSSTAAPAPKAIEEASAE